MLIAVKKETVGSLLDNALVVKNEKLVINSLNNWNMQPTATLTGRGLPGERSSSQVVTFSLGANETFTEGQFVGKDMYIFVNMENAKSIFCRFGDILATENKIAIDESGQTLTAEDRHDMAVAAILDDGNVPKRQVPDNQDALESANHATSRHSIVNDAVPSTVP